MAQYPMWKIVALQDALKEVIDIEDDGHEVERLTDYHWRINGIDVWPSSKKYMKNGKVHEYTKLVEVTR